MIIIKKAADLTFFLQQHTAETVGFVPTMGALHNGHLSLIDRCTKENRLTVCSIFINPVQFNNSGDFSNYPVTIEKDIELLVNAKCDVLFLPAVEEIYPADYVKKDYDLGTLAEVLEGAYRPGHFQGVCQAVDRLLSIVRPHCLYLGQKDFQQCLVIKTLVHQIYNDSITIKIGETQREWDGLAMSSRNLRLNPEQREKVRAIFETLVYIKNNINQLGIENVKKEGKMILTKAGFVTDYIEIAVPETLAPVEKNNPGPKVVLIAATIGSIRLIDNMILN
jgi:pantoate--beta-alanine ligase